MMTSTELTVHHLTSDASSPLSSLSALLLDAGRTAASTALSSKGWLDVPTRLPSADLARFSAFGRPHHEALGTNWNEA